MLAAFSPGSDFKRYYRGRMPRLALIVIILMPLMYGALYLWAFWNPFNAVDKIPVRWSTPTSAPRCRETNSTREPRSRRG